MKRFVLSLFAAMCAVSLSACGGTAEEQTSTDVPQAEVSETTAEQTETETTTTETSAETTSETTETETDTESTTEEATTTTETEKICACESEFQHACCEYLNELDFLAGGVYYGDINGDDKPEAVVEINPLELTYVLYENENGMQILPLETMSVWGYVRYIADTKQILYCPAHGHTWGTWGHEVYYLLDWNGSDYEVTSSIFRDSGIYYEKDDEEYSEYGQAYIDDEEVDNDTFEVKLAEFENIRDGNEYFPIAYIYDINNHHNPNPETYINYIKENFPCFNNWDIIPDMQE